MMNHDDVIDDNDDGDDVIDNNDDDDDVIDDGGDVIDDNNDGDDVIGYHDDGDAVVDCPTKWSLWYWFLDFYDNHLYFDTQMTW